MTDSALNDAKVGLLSSGGSSAYWRVQDGLLHVIQHALSAKLQVYSRIVRSMLLSKVFKSRSFAVKSCRADAQCHRECF